MRKWIGLAGLGTLCAACCAPLLLPLLAVIVPSVSIAAAYGDTVLCGGLVLLAAAVWWRFGRRLRAKARSCDCPAVCSAAACSPGEQR